MQIAGSSSHLANGPWNKSLNFIFPTKYVIPKSLKFSLWPSKFWLSVSRFSSVVGSPNFEWYWWSPWHPKSNPRLLSCIVITGPIFQPRNISNISPSQGSCKGDSSLSFQKLWDIWTGFPRVTSIHSPLTWNSLFTHCPFLGGVKFKHPQKTRSFIIKTHPMDPITLSDDDWGV